MNYLTYINNQAIFEINQCHPEWIAYIKSKGIVVSDKNEYNGELTDFMEALTVIEQITSRLINERKELLKHQNTNLGFHSFDLSWICDSYQDKDQSNRINEFKDEDSDYCSLFDYIHEEIHYNYIFLPYQFFLACQDKLEPAPELTTSTHFQCYKLKKGTSILIRAK